MTSNSGDLSERQIKELAREAYVFGFPQVYYYQYMYPQAIAEVSGKDYFFGGFNCFRHFGLGTPDQEIGVPNVDTPYSRAWVDTRAEPLVLTMPPAEPDNSDERRFYSSVWADLWGFVLDYPGSILDGNGGGSYLLASPSWRGELPPGVERVIRGETSMLCTVTRTEAFSPSDMPKVEEIQKGYQLQRLSEYLGDSAPGAAPEIDWPVPSEDALTCADSFFALFNFLLTQVTEPNPDDSGTYERIAQIGVGPNMSWDPDTHSDSFNAAVQAGLEQGRKSIQLLVLSHTDAAKAYGNRAEIGTDYLYRAAGVYAGGLAPNVARQAMYYQLLDKRHQAPDGSAYAYRLRFEAGELPPAEYFWSLTSYKLPERWLVENSIDRYAIGSHDQLSFDEDGSLTLYLQVERPDEGLLSNWLPIFDGPAFEILRLYGPDQRVLDGRWQPPQLERVEPDESSDHE